MLLLTVGKDLEETELVSVVPGGLVGLVRLSLTLMEVETPRVSVGLDWLVAEQFG